MLSEVNFYHGNFSLSCLNSLTPWVLEFHQFLPLFEILFKKNYFTPISSIKHLIGHLKQFQQNLVPNKPFRVLHALVPTYPWRWCWCRFPATCWELQLELVFGLNPWWNLPSFGTQRVKDCTQWRFMSVRFYKKFFGNFCVRPCVLKVSTWKDEMRYSIKVHAVWFVLLLYWPDM
jgi:hypothetical protein